MTQQPEERSIIEELRSAAETGHDSTGYVMEKAANVIERLRAGIKQIAGLHPNCTCKVCEMLRRLANEQLTGGTDDRTNGR